MTEEEALRRAAEVLSNAEDVALACHMNPDADALGSMLGLSNFLRARGVRTVCSYGNEPLDPPRWASLLPGTDQLVPPSAFPADTAVMVTCDCASFDRLGVLGASASRAGELIWIDHHRSNDGYGTVRLVDPDASSTCEMVFRLIEAMGGDFDRDVALCLYAGLVTDTGRFQYQATTPETLRVAARLREHDFDHAQLVRAMYEDNDPSFLRLLGIALGRMAELPEASVVWTYLTQADLAEAGIGARRDRRPDRRAQDRPRRGRRRRPEAADGREVQGERSVSRGTRSLGRRVLVRRRRASARGRVHVRTRPGGNDRAARRGAPPGFVSNS